MRRIAPWAVVGLLALAGCAADGSGRAERVAPPPPADLVGSVQRGAALVRARCASCHAVEATGDSPMPAAPPFRTLGAEYPVSDLQEAFAEGLVTAHPSMPAFVFEPDEILDLIAYLEQVSGTGPARD